jgi:hypothetical protein
VIQAVIIQRDFSQAMIAVDNKLLVFHFSFLSVSISYYTSKLNKSKLVRRSQR